MTIKEMLERKGLTSNTCSGMEMSSTNSWAKNPVGDVDFEGYHIYHDMPIEFLDSQLSYLDFNYQ